MCKQCTYLYSVFVRCITNVCIIIIMIICSYIIGQRKEGVPGNEASASLVPRPFPLKPQNNTYAPLENKSI